ncbi:MAG: thiamine pyrophosphate-binding protein [Deltaproteobacteria bacterium]|nr:thiamine pyrophosphate-binding protein [Deltaproteobacteria bacterium]
MHGGDMVAKVLSVQGVKVVFCLCGGHISPILVGCKRAGIGVLDVRNEATAVFAADAASRVTGIPGVAVVTAGPGVTNTVTAVKNARMAQSAMVLIGGAAPTVLKGRGALQDIDPGSLMATVAKAAISVRRNCDIVSALERAFLMAGEGVPGPVFVEMPVDLLYPESLARKWYGGATDAKSAKTVGERLKSLYLRHYVDRMFSCSLDEMETTLSVVSPPVPDADSVKKVAALLDRVHFPVMVLGSQAMLCPDRVGELAAAVDQLGIPVFLTGMARGLLGEDHRLQIRHKRKGALKQADLVIMAGMPCDFRMDYGRVMGRKTTLVAANRSKHDLYLNRKPDVALHADPFFFLAALARETVLQSGERWMDWRSSLTMADRQREAEIDAMANFSGQYVNPILFFRKLDRFLTGNAILVADGGDFVATAAYTLSPKGPLQWLDPGVFGTLGVGAGFALGARQGRPDAEVWILYGDGAAGYSITEMDTFVRHGLPVIAVVGNDAGWTQITRDQREILGDDVATVLARTDYHRVARGYGAEGLVVKADHEIDAALATARAVAAAGKPVLINLWIDPTDFRKGSISM